MDASDLKIFEAVARLGGMNRASAELNTVQSNVTARVRQLETALGMPLFHRNHRGVMLTDAGRRLLPYAARVRALLDEARRAVADDGRPKGALVIGSLETTAAVRLPPVLGAYAAAHPEVDLVLSTGTTGELVEAVLAQRVEGAFVCGPVGRPELEEETVFEEELVLLAAPAVRRVDRLLKEGAPKIVVLRAGCSYRARLERVLASRGVTGLRLLEFGTIEAILGCVSAGLGLTLLPRSLAAEALRGRRVSLHELPPEESRVETVFIRRRDAYLSSALAAFLRCARPASPRAEAAE